MLLVYVFVFFFFSLYSNFLNCYAYDYTVRSISELHVALKSKQYDALLVLFEAKGKVSGSGSNMVQMIEEVKKNFTGIKCIAFGRVWHPKKNKHSRFLQQLSLPSLIWFDGQTEEWVSISDLPELEFKDFIHRKGAQFTNWASPGNFVHLNLFTFSLYTNTSPRDLIIHVCKSLETEGCSPMREVVRELAWEMENQSDIIFAIMDGTDSQTILKSFNIERDDAVLAFSQCYHYGYGVIENSFPFDKYPLTLHNLRLFVNAMIGNSGSDLEVKPDTFSSVQQIANDMVNSNALFNEFQGEEEEEDDEENERSAIRLFSANYESFEETQCVFAKYCMDFSKFPLKNALLEKIRRSLPQDIEGIDETFNFVKEQILEHGLQYITEKEKQIDQCVHPKYKSEKKKLDKVIKILQKVFGKKLCPVKNVPFTPVDTSQASPLISQSDPPLLVSKSNR